MVCAQFEYHRVGSLQEASSTLEHLGEDAKILAGGQSLVPMMSGRLARPGPGVVRSGAWAMTVTVEPYLAPLTSHAGRSVRMIWNRQESNLASTKRRPFLMRYHTEVRSDGAIVAQDVGIIDDAGAYPYLNARILIAGAAVARGPYRTPNVAIRCRAVFTNNVPASTFRGFGAMQMTFAYEWRDTALNPPGGSTFATRQLYRSGNATLSAAVELRDRTAAIAGEVLGVPADRLAFRDGGVEVTAGPSVGKGLSLAELVRACEERGPTLQRLRSIWNRRGHRVEVRCLTRRRARNQRDACRGPDPRWRDARARLRADGRGRGGGRQPVVEPLRQLSIPTAMDMPDIQVRIVESSEGKGPPNARGTGEPPIGPAAGTIVNAITNAIGVRPYRLPMTPERMFNLLEADDSRARP